MLSEEFRKAETTPYYSTFTNNLQQERLAALQPSKDIDESDGDSLAHRLSETICGFYRALLYRIGVACLPCFEIASAFNLFGLFSPKNCEDDVLLSRATSPTSAHSVHSVQLMENGEANGVSGLDKEPPILSAASTTPKDHKKAKKVLTSMFGQDCTHHQDQFMGLTRGNLVLMVLWFFPFHEIARNNAVLIGNIKAQTKKLAFMLWYPFCFFLD